MERVILDITSHKKIVADFIKNQSEYFLFQDHKLPEDDAAEELFTDLPPGSSPDDKTVLGFFCGDTLAGICDCVTGFPQHSTLMIGLLIISHEQRGQGLGSEALRQVEDYAPENIEILRIGVLEDNTSALGFWKRAGFRDTGKRGVWERDASTVDIIVMENNIKKQDY